MSRFGPVASWRACGLTPKRLGALLDDPGFVDVAELDLAGNPALGHDAIELLVVSGHLSHLVALDVSAVPVGDRGVEALAESEQAAGLRSLRFGMATRQKLGVPFAHGSRWAALATCGLGDRALDALAGSDHLGALRTLDLFAVEASPSAWGALASAPWLADLTGLGVGMTDALRGTPLRLLLEALRRVERLVLERLQLGEHAALVASADLLALRSLSLAGNTLSEAVFAGLASAPWPRLVSLDLSDTSVGPHLARFSPRTGLPALQRLGVRGHGLVTDEVELWYDQGMVVGQGQARMSLDEVQRHYLGDAGITLFEPRGLWGLGGGGWSAGAGCGP